MPSPERYWNPTASMPPSESPIDRVLGLENEADGLELSKESFENQEKLPDELEKRPEEVESIAEVIAAATKLIESHGGRVPPLTVDHVHIVPFRASASQGRYHTFSGGITVTREGTDGKELSPLLFAHKVGHELLHLASFQVMEFDLENQKPAHHRRGGLLLADADGEPLGNWLNEAVTEALARVLSGRVQSKHLKSAERDGLAADGYEKGEANAPRHYIIEQGRLYMVLDALVAHDPERYPDSKEAFRLFTHAYFTGNMLPLARALEDCFEGGQVLRRLMEGGKIEPRKGRPD